LLFGAGLVVLAIFVVFGTNLTFPTRNYPAVFHFLGMTRYLLAGSLLIFGVVALAIGGRKLEARSRIAQLAVGAGLVLLGISFISAPRY